VSASPRIVRRAAVWVAVIVVSWIVALGFVAATPRLAVPVLDIEAPSLPEGEVEATLTAVRAELANLSLAEAEAAAETLRAQYPLLDDVDTEIFDIPQAALFGVISLGIALLGASALIRSQNRYGLWILAMGVLATQGSLGEILLDWQLRTGDRVVDVPPVTLVFDVWAMMLFPLGAVIVGPGLLGTFPTGRLISKRWRPIWWLSGLAAGLILVAQLFGPLSALERQPNSLRLFDAPTALSLFELGLVLWVAAGVVAALAVLVRFFVTTGEERLQMKWLAYGVVMAAVAGAVSEVLARGDVPVEITGPIQAIPLFVILPTIIVITIFRFRLYNIDLVINKTAMAAGLLVVIGGLYTFIVVGITAVLGSDEVGFDIQIIATVAVAIAFQPARRWAQRAANRLVYGRRATPYQVLADFGHRASEMSDSELSERAPHLIVDGTGAVEATIWALTESGFSPLATWPEDESRQPLPATGGFSDPDADYSIPVYHDDELLGGLSLVKQRGESMPETERELLDGLAAGLGLAMRNARLTDRLRRQVLELEESRERVLAAADEARRDLERELDSGPQQQLVALKVKLGPTRMKAERAGAAKTAMILSQLENEAGEAIQAVRDFAGGIYPPMLEAEGLVAAIRQQANRSPTPTTIQSEDVVRYDREIEAAVYFGVLEALQNAAKYADAESVAVTLAADGTALRFTVRDDGRGFDRAQVDLGAGLSNMADRLDAVGGRLDVKSSPGRGTTVTGAVPLGPGKPGM